MTLFGGVLPIKTISFLVFYVFAIAALGYLLGRVTIKGISLGSAGVFIVALLCGGMFYEVLEKETLGFTGDALKIIENVGLILFVTAVGFIAGPKFFGNFKRNFKSYVLIGFVIILSGALVTAGCIMIGRAANPGVDRNELTAMMAGLLSGALTSTPAFSATKAAVGAEYEDVVAVGYGIAYIFGVLGVVLFVQLMPKILHADIPAERAKLCAVEEGKEKKPYEGKLIHMDDFGFMPFALAAIIGIALGCIKIPLTGAGLSGPTFSLTTTGGCLMTALVMGHFSRIGCVSIMPKDSTLKVFRELGLMFFLIGAGVKGGASFLKYFQWVYFLYGALMTLLPMVVGFFVAKYILKLSLFNTLGSLTGGMTSTPALGTLIHVAGTEEVASAYAATYPIALISVVLASQFLIILF